MFHNEQLRNGLSLQSSVVSGLILLRIKANGFDKRPHSSNLSPERITISFWKTALCCPVLQTFGESF